MMDILMSPSSHDCAIAPEHFTDVLDTVADGVFAVDEHLRITTFNRAAEEITGLRRCDVVGRVCYEAMPGPACTSSCPLRRALATGRPGQAIQPVYVLGGLNRPTCMRTRPLTDSAGHVVGGVGVFRPADAQVATADPAAGPSRTLSILDASERAAIVRTLARHHGNQAAASQELGISRTTLWRKMRRLGIRSSRAR